MKHGRFERAAEALWLAAERPFRWAARMATLDNAHDRFWMGERDDQLRFVINDAVRILSGPHAGRTGAVISIITLEPEPTFRVEPGTPPYGDLQVRQSDLELIEQMPSHGAS